MKQWIANTILGLAGAVIGGFIVAKYQDIQSIPKIKEDQEENRIDQSEINIAHQGMLYQLNKERIERHIADSIDKLHKH
jgi:hypothetical protein